MFSYIKLWYSFLLYSPPLQRNEGIARWSVSGLVQGSPREGVAGVWAACWQVIPRGVLDMATLKHCYRVDNMDIYIYNNTYMPVWRTWSLSHTHGSTHANVDLHSYTPTHPPLTMLVVCGPLTIPSNQLMPNIWYQYNPLLDLLRNSF